MKTLLLLLVALAVPALAHAQDEAAARAAGCGDKKIQFEVKTDKRSHPKAKWSQAKPSCMFSMTSVASLPATLRAESAWMEPGSARTTKNPIFTSPLRPAPTIFVPTKSW